MTASADKKKSGGLGRIFRNFGSLTAGKILGDVFLFFLFVMLSRAFGQEGLGQYSFAMALTGFFMVVSDFGLEFLTIKEMSRHKGALSEYYGSIFALRILQSLAASLLLLLLLLVLPMTLETKIIVGLIGIYQFTYKIMDGFAAIFVAREEMHLAALLTSTLRIVAALLAVGVIVLGGGLIETLVVLPIVGLIQVVLGYIMVSRRQGRLKLAISRQYIADTMGRAWPYAVSEFLRQLSTRTDVVMLGFLLGTAAAGVYNVAYRIIFMLLFLPYFAAMSLFPLASKLFADASDEIVPLYHKALNANILVGIPASFGLWLIAPDLILLIFGAEFAESAGVLRWLAWLVLFFCLKFMMQIFLMSCDKQDEMTSSQWVAAGINVVGTLVLILTLGITGAAIATLVSEAVLVGLYAWRLQGVLGWPQIGVRMAIGSIAAASFYLPMLIMPSLSFIIFIPLAALMYAGALILFKEIRNNELQTLMSLIRR
jgi:O-antigen/teichoic acid export membrane protein